MASWDRLPDESEIAYEAFKVFLDIDGKRSTHEAAKRHSKSQSTIKRWYAKFH
jgi:transposase